MPVWERDTHVEKLRDKATLMREVGRKLGSLAAEVLCPQRSPGTVAAGYSLRGMGIECSDGQLSSDSARKRKGNRWTF